MFKIINVYFKFASSSLTSIAILAIVVRIMETAAKCETIKSQNFLQIPNIFYIHYNQWNFSERMRSPPLKKIWPIFERTVIFSAALK